MRVQHTDESFQERRSNLRYPVAAEIEFRLVYGQQLGEAGYGELVNISNGGILFRSATPLPAKAPIELSLAWPTRLGNGSALKLAVRGEIVRVRNKYAAVRIVSYNFRLRRNCLGWTTGVERHGRN